MKIREVIVEAFDQPYKTKSEKSEYGDVDMLAKLPDGSNLSIMFNQEYGDEGEEVVQVEFYRNNSQEVTGDGDAQRIFATVLDAIQKYIKKYKPQKLSFSASKEVDMDADNVEKFNPESRAKLYDRLVQRYARAWGYRAFRADTGSIVRYELSRLKPGVTEDSLEERLIPSTKPIDYPPLKKDGNGWWSTSFQVGTKLVKVAFQNSTGMPVNPKFAKLLKPEYLNGNKFTSFYDIAFEVGDNADDMTDAKNTGAPVKEALRILKAVAYIIKETVYAHRSELPFLYFWAHPGENRETLYAGLATELDGYFKTWGYKRLDPATALASPDPSAQLWASVRVFAPATTQPTKVAENFHDGKHPEDKGDSKRYGVPTKASISTLRKVAKQGGRKGQLAHWMANMKSGRAKAKK